jgi:hypothetical protein
MEDDWVLEVLPNSRGELEGTGTYDDPYTKFSIRWKLREEVDGPGS